MHEKTSALLARVGLPTRSTCHLFRILNPSQPINLNNFPFNTRVFSFSVSLPADLFVDSIITKSTFTSESLSHCCHTHSSKRNQSTYVHFLLREQTYEFLIHSNQESGISCSLSNSNVNSIQFRPSEADNKNKQVMHACRFWIFYLPFRC